MHSLCVLFPPKSERTQSNPQERGHSSRARGAGCSSRSHLSFTLTICWDSLFIRDGLVAAVADPHFKLEAHQGDGGAFGAALAADGLPALAAVVLQRENPDSSGVSGYAQR